MTVSPQDWAASRPLGYFGKLPSAADFVSDPRGIPDALAWSRWLRESVERVHERFGHGGSSRLRSLEPTCFRFAGDNGGLIGALVPSRDTSGRAFPFCVFAGNEPEPRDRPGDDLLRARVVAHSALRAAESGQAPAASPDLSAPAVGLLSAEDRLAACTLGALDDAFAGPIERSRTLLAVGNLLELAHRPPREAGSTIPSFGLRLPLPGDAESVTSALSFWSGVLERFFPIPQRETSAFWWSTAAGGAVDFYLERPSAVAFLHIVDPTLDSEHLYWVDEAVAPRNPRVPEPARATLAELEDGDRPLSEILSRLPAIGDAA